MMKMKNVDMIHGNLYKSIILYSIPLLFMGLIQKLFNAVDVMVLGAVADTNAVASVGATSNVVSLLVDTFFSIATGTRVVLSRILGAQDRERANKTASTSILIAIVLGVITMVGGILVAPYFLEWTNCPAECVDGALIYIRIYLLAAPMVLLYNFGAAILEVTGDTQRPLIYMLIAGATNVVLNFALCFVLEEKVAAVAIATVVSQAIGAVLALTRLFRMKGVLELRVKTMRWSFEAFRGIMKQGVPIAIYHAMYPIANLQIQSQVNSFGPAYIAAGTVTSNLDAILVTIACTPLASAITTFAGQNLGAGKKERVTKTILFCTLTSVALTLVLGVIGFTFARPLASLFLPGDALAIEAARERMTYLMLPYFIASACSCLSRVIQAFGHSTFTTVNCVITVIGFRFFWTWVVFDKIPTYGVLCLCFPASWVLTTVVNLAFVLYLYHAKFKKDKLKKI